MYGAMIGDIIGSAYESTGIKTKRFLLFPINTSITDDSIMTVAVARALMSWNREKESLHDAMIRSMRKYGWKYPDPPGKYDIKFQKWLTSYGAARYNSCDNGSAMRVSPCGLLATSLEEAVELAHITTRYPTIPTRQSKVRWQWRRQSILPKQEVARKKSVSTSRTNFTP